MHPINIYTFVHDTVSEDDQKLKGQLFDVFTSELTDITGRPVNVIFERAIAGVTDFDYLSYYAGYPHSDFNYDLAFDTLSHEWWAVVENYMEANNLVVRRTDIYLLLIDGILAPMGEEGFAFEGSHVACASTFSLTNVAHEIGHCFQATHELAALYPDTEFNDPNQCATYMATFRPHGSCRAFRYSDENRLRIINSLKNAPLPRHLSHLRVVRNPR